MASDTGAPWNLPYPEDTDLVRDGASDIEALAVATAAGLSTASQVVAVKFAIKTDIQATSIGSPGNTAVTGLTISHAAASATNRVILIANVNGHWAAADNTGVVGLILTAGGTPFAIGDAAGVRSRRSAATAVGFSDGAATTAFGETVPGVTSAVTYGVDITSSTGTTSTLTYYVNRNFSDADETRRYRSASTLMLMEVQP